MYNKQVHFKVVGTGYDKVPQNFDPSKGTISRAIATCLVCGSVVDNKTTARLFREGNSGHVMVAVISYERGLKGKKYRISSHRDHHAFTEAEQYLRTKRNLLMEKFGIDPVPDEPTPEGKGRGAERAFSIRNYGITTWGDLFNSIQKLAMIVFTDMVRSSYHKMIEEG